MSNLDKKLEVILRNLYFRGWVNHKASLYHDNRMGRREEDESVSQSNEAIKQALIEDGWIRIPQVELIERWEKGRPIEYRVNGKIMMTKEEWERQAVNDGWLSPDRKHRVQQMVNLMATTAQELAEFPVFVREPGAMTGPEWYNRFRQEMGEGANACTGCSCDAMNAAKKAAGIEESEL